MPYDDLEGWDGGGRRDVLEGGDVSVHFSWLIYFIAQQRLKQHCKANILQKKKGHFLISPEVMQVWDLFHTKPTEFTATHRAGHMITASIIHLDNVSTASWAWLNVVCWGEGERMCRKIPLLKPSLVLLFPGVCIRNETVKNSWLRTPDCATHFAGRLATSRPQEIS